jgi:hypothetical protein
MRAIGFGDPVESSSKEGSVRNYITLRALPVDFHKLKKLPSEVETSLKAKRSEIDQEVTAAVSLLDNPFILNFSSRLLP